MLEFSPDEVVSRVDEHIFHVLCGITVFRDSVEEKNPPPRTLQTGEDDRQQNTRSNSKPQHAHEPEGIHE